MLHSTAEVPPKSLQYSFSLSSALTADSTKDLQATMLIGFHCQQLNFQLKFVHRVNAKTFQARKGSFVSRIYGHGFHI